MPYIYKITNTINNKAYIGKTISTIGHRWKEHCNMASQGCLNHRPLYNAMKKYGVDNFTIEQVEECPLEDLSDKEIYWIQYYDTFHNGYNATYGGDGRQYVDYDIIYELFQQGKTCKEIHEITKHDYRTIANALNNKGIDSKEIRERAAERIRRGAEKRSKPVARLDKNTGEILEVFNSIHEADRIYKTGIGNISNVCQGKRKTAAGYEWKYI